MKLTEYYLLDVSSVITQFKAVQSSHVNSSITSCMINR